MAAEIAVSALEEDVIECSADDNDLLQKVASTSMAGRAAGSDIRFAKILVEALAHVTHETESGIRCEAEDVLFEKLEDSTINDTHMVTGVFWRQRIPMERMASPSEISYYIFNLASETNSFMTGQTITVSGGE